MLLSDLLANLGDPTKGGPQALMALGQALVAAGSPQPVGGSRLGAASPYLQQAAAAPLLARQQAQQDAFRKAQLQQMEAQAQAQRNQQSALGMLSGMQGPGPSSTPLPGGQEILWRNDRPGLLNAQGAPTDYGRAIAGMIDPAALAKNLLAPPQVDFKTIQSGDKNITYSIDARTGKMAPVAEGPRWEPQQANPNAQPFSSLGSVWVDETGAVQGPAIMDQRSGRAMVDVPGAGLQAPKPNWKLQTRAAENAPAMGGEAFYKLNQDVVEAKQGVDQLAKYWQTVKNAPQGMNLLMDKYAGTIKTIFGGNITPEQLQVMQQQGRLQGLIGRFRKEVVGGGVMTEQDALRIIEALGGDLSSARNKEVAGTLLRNILEQKMQTYNEAILPNYNEQIAYPGRKGRYKPIEPFALDLENMFGAGSGGPQGAAPGTSPPQGPVTGAFTFDAQGNLVPVK